MYNYQYEEKRVIFVIDSKSFYASVEAVQLGLDPMKALLVVLSHRENDGSGLVMSASPAAKETLGITNVMRARDLPDDKLLLKVEPRMNLYIEKNLEINRIFQKYAATEDIYAYSIDESFIDMTTTWRMFGETPEAVAKNIQAEIREVVGVQTTCGIGPNPTLAKIALDIGSKHNEDYLAHWEYSDVPTKLWPITNLSHVWSLGRSTVKKLDHLGINSVGELAHTDPDKLVKHLGKRGAQLFALSWGVDRTIISQRHPAKHRSVGNSQILPRSYHDEAEIKLVIREIAEQVATRIRTHHEQAKVVSLGIGFADYQEGRPMGFNHRQTLTAPTHNSEVLIDVLNRLFEKTWRGEPVRHISVTYGHLQPEVAEQLSLFEKQQHQVKQLNSQKTVDDLRHRFGFKSVIKASSQLEGGTAVYRASLVGGHAGGNTRG